MQPYVIRQGDYLLSLAYQFGFDADTVWNDPKNAQLRQLRPNPNILFPGDLLYIPDQNGPPAMKTLTTGATNSFVADAQMVTITITFSDPSLASQAYSIQEFPELTALTSEADGTVTFSVPVTLDTATITFTDAGMSFACKIGGMDPMNTLSGVFLRLQNLGFIDLGTNFDPTDLDFIRAALRAFKAAQPGGSPPPSDSSPAGSPSPASEDPSPPLSYPPSPPASAPSPSDGSSSPPPSVPASSPGASASPQDDDAGLGEDGKLDDATSKLLLASHGS